MVSFLRNDEYARWLLTVVRVWIGYEWLLAGLEKIGAPTWTGSKAGLAIGGFLNNAVNLAQEHAVQGWYAGFLRDVAIPLKGLLTYLVPWGELLVGLALILGCFTTFAAFMGAVMNTAFMLAGTTSTNPNFLIGEVFIMVAGFNAAVYGLDRWAMPWFRKLVSYEISAPNQSTRPRA